MLRIIGPGLLALLVLLFDSPAMAQPTTTTLTTSINPSEPYTELDLTASVTPDSGGPASGSVEFFDGSTSLGTASLQSGTGQTTLEDVRPLTAGVHSLTAVYTSDSTFSGSSSAPYSQTVNAIPPDASVSSSTGGSPSMAGDDVTFTATVDAPSSVGGSVPDPGGTVTFSIDDADVGTVPFDGFGTATFTTGQLAVGSHTVKATYNGDSYYAAATTMPLTQVVKGSTTTTMGCSCSIPAASGQTISIDATITVVAPGTGTPTGTVEFFVNGASVGTEPVVEVTPGYFWAAISTTALSAIGDYDITAIYSGDANFVGSTSNTMEIPVIQAVPMTLVSSVNPSDFGQQVTFTVTLGDGVPLEGRQINLFAYSADAGIFVGSVGLSGSGGVVNIWTSTLPIGTNRIVAGYDGDGTGGFPYTEVELMQTVNATEATTTTLSATPNPSATGQSVTFTATVSGGSGPPTGTVSFKVDGSDVAPNVALSAGGEATFETSTLTVGPHTVVATYNGDTTYSPSTSDDLAHSVLSATTTALGTDSTIPAGALQPITFDATVTPVAPGGDTPTGTVTFFVDSVATETVTLDASGIALFTVAAGFPIGSNDIDAVYNGDPSFAGSSSNTLPMEFIKGSVITLTPSAGPTVVGEPVTFTLALTGDGAPIVGGFVYAFDEGYAMLGSTLTNAAGEAYYPTSTLVVGPHTISATYNPDPGDEFAYSRVELQHTVNQASTTTSVSSDINPSTLGQEVELRATVTVDAPGSGTPTGTVSFYDGATLLGSSPLIAGEATFATAALVVGPRSITAIYNGDASFTGSTSPELTQTVDDTAATITVLSATPNPSLAGQSVSFTATVSGGTSTPTGTVTFNVDGTDVVPNVSLTAGGEASFYTSTLTAGSHTVIATYNGDSTHLTSSDSETQVVQAVATTTSLTSSQNPSNSGQPVTFTATVTGAGGPPTGTVKFLAGGVQFGVVPLNASGVATFTTSGLGVGSHEIEAEYTGDAAFGPSTSDALTQVVDALGTVALVVTTDGGDASFGFTSPTPSLNLTVVTAGGTGSSGDVALVAGSYSISAQSMAAAGFALSGIDCDDTDSTGDAGSGIASIALAAGEDVTCTFAFVDSRAAATELIEDFFDTRAELILSHGPNSQRRIDRLNGIAPSVGNPASALMGLMPMVSGGGPRALSGSLGAIEQAMADPAEPAAFDIWFETSFGAYGSNAAQGNFGIAYLGADYLVSSDLLVGALFQLDRVGFDSNTGDATAEGTGWMIGPYVTGRLGDNLYVDLRAAAGRSANSISPYGTYTDEVDASRWLIEAAVTGEWTDGSWTFQPTARLSYFEETSDAYTDGLGVYVPSVTSGTGQLALGPALSYRFVTDGEIDVVLGAALDGVLDFSLDGGALVSDGAHAELEASIDLSLPGGARIGASVKAGGLGEDDFHFLSGTVSVSAAIQ